jgi:hypothetical protein
MHRPPLTVERLALFGALLTTFGELHPACDHWVIAAPTVSACAHVADVEVAR